MDTKLALVKMITLLYRESHIIDNSDRSTELVNSVLATIKAPKIAMENSDSKETIYQLRSTVQWMLDHPVDAVFNKDELIVRLRCNISEQNNLYQSVTAALNMELGETALKQSCMEIRSELQDHMGKFEIKRIFNEIGKSVVAGNFVTRDIAAETVEKLEKYLHGPKAAKSKFEVARVNGTNTADFKEIVRKGMDEEIGDGGIQFGLQGLNRMFGHTGKMRFGEWWHVYALPHNYKSSMLLRFFIDACLYNDPPPCRPGTKPCIMRISFENEAHRDIIQVFEYLYVLEHKAKPDYAVVDEEYMHEFINSRLAKRGWHWEMLRYDPSDFTYRDLIDTVDRIESEGYHVHFVEFDYLNMISKQGCTQGAQGAEVRDLIRRVRNFCSRKNILGINAHQLSTEAKGIIRGGFDQKKFLEEIEGKGYFDSCRAIDNEPDGEIYIHIYENKKLDQSWLMFHRGKHRKVSITPPADKSFSYLMDPILGLPCDIYGKDLSYTKPGGLSRSEDIDDVY